MNNEENGLTRIPFFGTLVRPLVLQYRLGQEAIDGQLEELLDHSSSLIAAATILLTQAGSPAIEAEAVAMTWDAGGDGTSWSHPYNWNPNGLPNSTDAISITNCSPDCDPFAIVWLDIDFTLDPGGSILIDSPPPGPGGSSPVLAIRSGNTLTNNGLITNHGTIGVEFEGAPSLTGGTIDSFGSFTWGNERCSASFTRVEIKATAVIQANNMHLVIKS